MRKLVIAALLGVWLAGRPVRVAEAAAPPVDVDRPVKLVEAQAKTIKALTTRVEHLEAATRGMRAVLDEEVDRAKAMGTRVDEMAARPAIAPGLSKLAAWAEKVKFSGDLRYRHEFFDVEDDRYHRNRQRIRARLKMHAKPSDELDVIFRLASGSDDPVSTNQTLGGAFSSKRLWLDQAYFNYHPDALAGVHVLGGKMANPFHRPQGSQLIFDGDLNPEGLALTYTHPLNGKAELFAAAGGFWIGEVKAHRDSMLYDAQAGVKTKLGGGVSLTAGASYYNYTDTKGNTVFFDPTESFGNSAEPTSPGAGTLMYSEDYELVEGFVEVGFKAGDTPIALFGDYVSNIAASSGEDTGWMLGFKVGKTKKPGDWDFSYNYRDLERDAVIGALCDSDFIGGGTDGRGHTFGVGYQLSKSANVSATYFVNEQGLDEMRDYRRLQLDFNVKF